MRKIEAFTILELVVAMIISAIVISITYTSYFFISESYQSFNVKNENLSLINDLDLLLKHDFYKAVVITKTDSGINIHTKKGNVAYTIGPDFLVRLAAKIDTFKLQTPEIQMTFEGAPIDDAAITEEQNRIDNLHLTFIYHDESFTFHYHKQYSSADLINRKPNASN